MVAVMLTAIMMDLIDAMVIVVVVVPVAKWRWVSWWCLSWSAIALGRFRSLQKQAHIYYGCVQPPARVTALIVWLFGYLSIERADLFDFFMDGM